MRSWSWMIYRWAALIICLGRRISIFFKHSITDAAFMQQLLKAWCFDYIYLLAAVASVADTIQRPIATHEINEVANLNILETIKTERLSVQKLLFASSAAVYGNQPELPKAETSPIDPLIRTPLTSLQRSVLRSIMVACLIFQRWRPDSLTCTGRNKTPVHRIQGCSPYSVIAPSSTHRLRFLVTVNRLGISFT